MAQPETVFRLTRVIAHRPVRTPIATPSSGRVRKSQPSRHPAANQAKGRRGPSVSISSQAESTSISVSGWLIIDAPIARYQGETMSSRVVSTARRWEAQRERKAWPIGTVSAEMTGLIRKGTPSATPMASAAGQPGREDRKPFAVDGADQVNAKRLVHRSARCQGVDAAQRKCLRLKEVMNLVGPGKAVER